MFWNFHKPTIVLSEEKHFKNWGFLCQTFLPKIFEQGSKVRKTKSEYVRQVLAGSLIQPTISLDGLMCGNT